MKTQNVVSRALAFLVVALLAASCSPEITPTALPKAPAGISTVSSQSNSALQEKWNETVAAAKAEGSLAIYHPSGAEMRQRVGEEFYKKFGIRIEWTPGRSNELVQKILSERRAGIYNADVLVACTMSALNSLKPAGALAPLEAKLILPEVKDTSKWFQEKHWWVDNEKTHLAYAAIPQAALVINTDLVKKDELKSFRDLLNPKWKGKMVMDTPFVGGSGNSWVTGIGHIIMNTDYLQELARQEPTILQDSRQEAEWIARGKYPIGLGQSVTEVSLLMKAGITNLDVVTPAEGTWLSQSSGAMSVLNNAPHPNAALVYFNWALTKEGQTIISQSEGYQSARVDVAADFLESWSIRQPGVKYFDGINYEYNLKKQEYLDVAKKMFVKQ